MPSGLTRTAIALVALLDACLASSVNAQTAQTDRQPPQTGQPAQTDRQQGQADRQQGQADRQQEGLLLRGVTFSSGYGFVQLPPVTISGFLPLEALNADSINEAEGTLLWRNLTHTSFYGLDVSGNYTARARFSELNAFGGNATFGMSHGIGRSWRASIGADGFIAKTTFGTFAPGPQSLVPSTGTIGELSDAVAAASSANPDPRQLAIFVPISQSVAAAEFIGSRLAAAGAHAGVTYASTARLSASFGVGYSSIRDLSPSQGQAGAATFPDSNLEAADADLTYFVTRQTQLRASGQWIRSSGAFDDEVTSASGGFQWTGRKWVVAVDAGGGFRPRVASSPVTGFSQDRFGLKYDVHVGYRAGSHTFLVGHMHGFHDAYGYGSFNAETGFGGGLSSVNATWGWSPPTSKWNLQSYFTLFKSPGNFLWIYTWLETTQLDRRLTKNLLVRGEFLFDRNGSRAYEGHHMSWQTVRLSVAWTPGARLF